MDFLLLFLKMFFLNTSKSKSVFELIGLSLQLLNMDMQFPNGIVLFLYFSLQSSNNFFVGHIEHLPHRIFTFGDFVEQVFASYFS